MNQIHCVLFTGALNLILVLIPCHARGQDLTSTLISILAEEGLTGVAWSLVDESGVVTLGSAGMQDNEASIKFSTNTRFHVGSVTKSLLATGILRMVTEGRLDLDRPVSDYLANPAFNNSWETEVTIRHLLDHTSGLNDAYLWQMFSERPSPDTPLAEAFPEPQTQLKIRSKPGARFSYSNMGYTLLGMVIEAVAAERYETYLDRVLLEPLGMNDSTFTYTSQQGAADPGLAWGHVDDGSRIPASPMFLRPAGQFTSTAQDLAKFAKFLLSDGRINGSQFIAADLMRARGRPRGTEAANAGLVAGYALGLGRRDRHGVVGFCHGGNIVGFVAMVCVFPESNKAFAYSVNTDSETASYGRIDGALILELGLQPVLEPASLEPAPNVREWHGRYILSPNRFQTFEYLDTVFGAVKLTQENAMVLMSSLQQATRILRPIRQDIFSAANRATESHALVRGDQGELLISDGFKTFKKVSSAYLFAHWGSVALGILGLTWLWAAGVISLIRAPRGFIRMPEAPAFLAIMALALPIPLFMTQSFMALGDVTPASVMLTTVTVLLPVGVLLTLIRSMLGRHDSRLNVVHAIAAALFLQWSFVLYSANMLPMRLWS
ncbi:MAG TPA: serine hydrolase domain-containing protein [Xanthomonadales bacterium]|nr:serine hydrolase domain-containing protein [Xanthomonadales bacterium]